MSETTEQAQTPGGIEIFGFGDPLPVIDGRDFLGYFRSAWQGTYYEPPISLDGLAKSLRASVHHESAIRMKANVLASCYVGHRLLKRGAFRRMVMDHLVFGNSYLQRIENAFGGLIGLEPPKARYVRVAKEGRIYQIAESGLFEFKKGTVFHLMDPDVDQEIYGTPGYVSALQSAFLNEAATLFRRKYYINGSHAGFILYLSDAAHSTEDIEAIRAALKDAKGIGNFKNLFVYSPGGKENGLKIIPIAEVAAKDEFLNIKNVTRDDVLAAHRVPPALMGIVPSNNAGFGNAETAAKVFARNEIAPLQEMFKEINDWIGDEIVRFNPYTIEPESAAAPGATMT
jgi:PBSX family phage portal protein